MEIWSAESENKQKMEKTHSYILHTLMPAMNNANASFPEPRQIIKMAFLLRGALFPS